MFYRAPSHSIIGILVLVVSLGACGKKTTNGADTTEFQQGADARGATGADATAAGAGSGSEDATAGNSNSDLSEFLQSLITQESEDRATADANLQSQIDDLSARMDALEAKLAEEIERLDAKDADLQAQLDTKAEIADLAALEAKLSQSIEDLAAEMRAEINVQITAVNTEITNVNTTITNITNQISVLQGNASANAEEISNLESRVADLETAKTELEGDLADLETAMNANDQELADMLRAEFEAEIGRLEADLAAFKLYAEQTYATKEELAVVKRCVVGLKIGLVLLAAHTENSLQELDARLTAQIADQAQALTEAFEAKLAGVDYRLNAVETDVATLQQKVADLTSQLASHISDYESEIAQMKADSATEIEALKKQIADGDAANQAQVAALNGKINKMQLAVGVLAAYSIKTRQILKKKVRDLKGDIVELQAKDAELANDILATEQRLNQALAKETAARQQLESDMKVLAAELAIAQANAKAALDMAQANQAEIAKLRGDLERVEQEFAAELRKVRKQFNNRLTRVRNYATRITRRLGLKMQRRFTRVNAQIAELQQQIGVTINIYVNIFVEINIGRDAIDRDLMPENKKVLNALENYRATLVALENGFIDAIDPVLGSTGVDVARLNSEFSALAELESCQGSPAIDGHYSSIRDREWFFHLARQYATASLTGSGAKDGFYFNHRGYPRVEQGIFQLLLAGSLQPYAEGTKGACIRQVNAWARKTLRNPAVRKAIKASTTLPAFAADVHAKAKKLAQLADRLENRMIAMLLPFLGSETAAFEFCKAPGGDDKPSPFAQYAQALLAEADDHATLAEVRANRDRIIKLAQDVLANEKAAATNAADIANINTEIDALTSDVNELKSTIAELANCVEDVKEEVAAVKDGTVEALNLIAILAGRLGGFDDIIDRAVDEIEDLGGEVDPEVSAMRSSCLAVSHFYNHATNRNLPVAQCESSTSVAGSLLDNTELTRCAVHVRHGRRGLVYGYTWGNDQTTTLGWRARNRAGVGGHRVGDGLRINHYDPTDAKAMELASRADGSAYPSDRESTFVLAVTGRADRFKIDVTSVRNANHHPYSVEVDASAFQVASEDSDLVHHIPLPKAIQRLGACHWNREITVTALDRDGEARGTQCVHRFHTFSPIVLNLADSGMIDTVNPIHSHAKFDLDANGIMDHTGWIKPGSALLALDLDGNGLIDDGRELFGEATMLPNGGRAKNGYAALAQHDSNGDGFIDQQDPIYSSLKLWIDVDQDGESARHELKRLADLGVTKIGLDYSSVAADKSIQSHGLPEANLVKYQSRYWGPAQCGKEGCAAFDVYFGSTENTIAKR